MPVRIPRRRGVETFSLLTTHFEVARASVRSRFPARLAAVEKVELSEVFLDRPLGGEVELFKVLGGEAGALDAAFTAVALPGGDLSPQEDLGEALLAPGLLRRPVSERGQRPRGRRSFSARNRCASPDAVLVMPGSAGRIWPADDLDLDFVAPPAGPEPLELGLVRRIG